MKHLFFVLSIMVLFGCKQSSFDIPTIEAPEGRFHWPILKVEGQTSGSVDKTITLDVFCPTSSGCDYISKLSSVREGSTIYIKVFGGTLTNSPCTMGCVPIVAKFEFTPVTKGKYTFKFISRDNSIIEHRITVRWLGCFFLYIKFNLSDTYNLYNVYWTIDLFG